MVCAEIDAKRLANEESNGTVFILNSEKKRGTLWVVKQVSKNHHINDKEVDEKSSDVPKEGLG